MSQLFHDDENTSTLSTQWARILEQPSRFAPIFFGLSLAVLGLATVMAWALIATSRFQGATDRLVFPPAFGVSTLLLVLGSWHLEAACRWVRIERQAWFRRNLVRALVCGIAFVSTQTYGLWCFLAQREIASLMGVRGGAFAFVVMHGVHFVVALLFVVFVLLRAIANRYDHEYSWGVVFCAWFWHALGILWFIIMGALWLASSLLHNEPNEWAASEVRVRAIASIIPQRSDRSGSTITPIADRIARTNR